MTPYFGVSLYIWSGILSITLISLALGYYAGGWLCRRVSVQRQHYLFVLLPSLAAIFLFVSALVYPHIFLDLASYSLVGGAFIACIILLFVPLLLLSGMNPILVAILSNEKNDQSDDEDSSHDSGAGLVFFISTVGSVIGVLLSAFLFIPNVPNFNSVLILSAALPILSLLTLLIVELDRKRKREIAIISGIAIVLSVGLLINSASYLKKNETISYNNIDWKIEKEYTSLFGNTKVIRLNKVFALPNGEKNTMQRWLYFQDGIAQNMMEDNGQSASIFSYVLEYMSKIFKSDAESALILGLAAGFLPQRMHENGIAVDVVEINPNALEVAKEHFHFIDTGIRVFEEDARTYVRRCDKKYDIVVVDLFQGDGVPDYLLTQEFFHDMKQCMTTNGIAFFNTFGNIREIDTSYYHILKTLNAEFEVVKMLYDNEIDDSTYSNIYLFASTSEKVNFNSTIRFENMSPNIRQQMARIFSKLRSVDETKLAKASILTDEFNVFSNDNAENYLRYRELLIKNVPPEMLVN